jgi:GNAT superfamily N-acetyltransferase
MVIRNVQPSDYTPIISALNDWWGGRKVSAMLPRLFFEHFCDTGFIIEEDNRIAAFLIGFLSQSRPDEAYIHFVGVHPHYRKRGLGRILYEKFFALLQEAGRKRVRCVTSPVNLGSIAFHTRMGFSIEPGEQEPGGVFFDPDHDGPGEDRVCFVRQV